MVWWQWLVGILMFILALGVLVGIHELGHLAAAKAFKVYCFNYSIGFGPVLISSKRSKKHETIWTLRAIPLGGFVSMYGEGAELDTDEYVPPSRSLEGVARYKRGIIVSAGVTLNFILGFILILCHNCFDHISFNLYSMKSKGDPYSSSMVVNVDDSVGDIKTGDYLKLNYDPLAKVKVKNVTYTLFLLGKDVDVEGTKYALCFKNSIATTKVDPDISTSLALIKQISVEDQINANLSSFTDSTLKTMIVANENLDTSDEAKMKELDNRIKGYNENDRKEEFKKQANTYYEKMGGYTVSSDGLYTVANNTPNVKAKISYYRRSGSEFIENQQEITIKPNEKKNDWSNTGIRLKRTIERYDIAKTFRVSWQEWCNSNTAVFRGLGMLFSGKGEATGIIGIAQMSATTLANFGFERYLFLWGMISCNLAIINLLPFPGLDGFTLLVTAYEGVRKKQVPTKFKAIVSFIGLALLFTLMIFILIKDIIRLI